jgi:hypothetical protein
VLLQPSPLQPLADLAQRSAAGYANIAGVLTATYPDMWREDLGRKVCVRYPNGGERRRQMMRMQKWSHGLAAGALVQ